MSARLALLGSVFMMALASGSANAATLIGATVDGSFKFPANTNNYFDPSVGFVPAGYLNSAGLPVTVEDPAKELVSAATLLWLRSISPRQALQF
jgi:hypothetical protein